MFALFPSCGVWKTSLRIGYGSELPLLELASLRLIPLNTA